MIFSENASLEPASSIAYPYCAIRPKALPTPNTMTCDELVSLINQMRKSFGFPKVGGKEILQKISETNRRLDSTLGRKLPSLLDS